MTTGFAQGIVNGWLDAAFGTTFAQLHTTDPGAAGTTNPSACDATRHQATMAAAAGGSKSASGPVGPWTNDGTPATETISHISLWSAATAGTFGGSAALTVAKTWAAGDTLTLSSLQIAITPIAA